MQCAAQAPCLKRPCQKHDRTEAGDTRHFSCSARCEIIVNWRPCFQCLAGPCHRWPNLLVVVAWCPAWTRFCSSCMQSLTGAADALGFKGASGLSLPGPGYPFAPHPNSCFWVEPLFPILVLRARLRKAGLPHGVQCVPPALLRVSMTVPVLGSLRGRVVARCFRWLAPALG